MRFKDVKRIIDEWDPINLLSHMCPPDEYDSETREIWKAALGINEVKPLAKSIFKCFNRNFGDFKNYTDDCNVIAEKILKLSGDRAIQIYHCPLLRREISEDYCSTIIMIALGCKNVPVEEKDPIDKKVAINICLACENLLWTKEDLKGFVSSKVALDAIFGVLEKYI